MESLDGVQRILNGANYVLVQRHANSSGVAELGEMRIMYP